jgi:precorrin-6A/cobalt-precorrin-6A reductase
MILLLGGTGDTEPIATGLARAGYRVLVSLATDILLDAGSHGNIEKRTGPLDAGGLASLIRKRKIRLVVDAAHPYAVSAHASAREAARETNTPYLTYVRPGGVAQGEGIAFAASHEEAARVAFADGRPVFLTTGVRNLSPYVREASSSKIPLVVRILPHPASLQTCLSWGIPQERIISARGPFPVETNREAIRTFQIGVLVTKDSGVAGGVAAKIEAARREGCLVVVVKRPESSREGIFESIPTLLDHVKSLISADPGSG